MSLVFAVAFTMVQVAQVSATDYSSHNQYQVGISSYQSISWQLNKGDGIYGNFTVTLQVIGGNAGINFFISDSANYALWTQGKTAQVYLLQNDIHFYKWNFSIPSSGTWYIVYDNTYASLGKTVDSWIRRDDTPPVINIVSTSINGVSYTYGASVQITITASASDNKQLQSFGLYIDNSLVSSGSSITYNFNTNTMSAGSHTVEFVAWDWANHETTVTWTFQIVAPSGGGGGGGYSAPDLTTPALLIAIITIVVIVIVALAVRNKQKQPSVGSRREVEDTLVKTKKVEPEKVAAESTICPYCGHKNRIGAKFCGNCGSDVSSVGDTDEAKS